LTKNDAYAIFKTSFLEKQKQQTSKKPPQKIERFTLTIRLGENHIGPTFFDGKVGAVS